MKRMLAAIVLCIVVSCTNVPTPSASSPTDQPSKELQPVTVNGNMVLLANGEEIPLPNDPPMTDDVNLQACASGGTGPFIRTTSPTGTSTAKINYMRVNVTLPAIGGTSTTNQVKGFDDEMRRYSAENAKLRDDPNGDATAKERAVLTTRNLRQVPYAYFGGAGNGTDEVDAGFYWDPGVVNPSGTIGTAGTSWKLYLSARIGASIYFNTSTYAFTPATYRVEMWNIDGVVFIFVSNSTGATRLGALAFKFPTANWKQNGIGNRYKQVVSVAQADRRNSDPPYPTDLLISYERYAGEGRMAGVVFNDPKLGFINNAQYTGGTVPTASGPWVPTGTYNAAPTLSSWNTTPESGCPTSPVITRTATGTNGANFTVQFTAAPKLALINTLNVPLTPDTKTGKGSIFVTNQGNASMNYKAKLLGDAATITAVNAWLTLPTTLTGIVAMGGSAEFKVTTACPEFATKAEYVANLEWTTTGTTSDYPFAAKVPTLVRTSQIRLKCPSLVLTVNPSAILNSINSGDLNLMCPRIKGTFAVSNIEALVSSTNSYIYEFVSGTTVVGAMSYTELGTQDGTTTFAYELARSCNFAETLQPLRLNLSVPTGPTVIASSVSSFAVQDNRWTGGYYNNTDTVIGGGCVAQPQTINVRITAPGESDVFINNLAPNTGVNIFLRQGKTYTFIETIAGTGAPYGNSIFELPAPIWYTDGGQENGLTGFYFGELTAGCPPGGRMGLASTSTGRLTFRVPKLK
jgi:hypothetical protein